MATQNKEGKWNPVIFDRGFIKMTELINNEWEYIECDTQEQAEQLEREYKEF